MLDLLQIVVNGHSFDIHTHFEWFEFNVYSKLHHYKQDKDFFIYIFSRLLTLYDVSIFITYKVELQII